MTTIFSLTDDPDPGDKINLDDLYEKRKQENLETLRLYNRILQKVHDRIKVVSRQRNADQICWYVVPEVILGVPRYDHDECVHYIMDKLQANGFRVQYTHPNLLFVCWAHYVPSYVRSEIKKKTGVHVDDHGVPVPTENDDDEDAPEGGAGGGNLFDGIRKVPRPGSAMKKPSVRFNLKKNRSNEPVETAKYKPTGKMVYNQSVVDSLESRLSGG